jgi:hypothetical protein
MNTKVGVRMCMFPPASSIDFQPTVLNEGVQNMIKKIYKTRGDFFDPSLTAYKFPLRGNGRP